MTDKLVIEGVFHVTRGLGLQSPFEMRLYTSVSPGVVGFSSTLARQIEEMGGDHKTLRVTVEWVDEEVVGGTTLYGLWLPEQKQWLTQGGYLITDEDRRILAAFRHNQPQLGVEICEIGEDGLPLKETLDLSNSPSGGSAVTEKPKTPRPVAPKPGHAW